MLQVMLYSADHNGSFQKQGCKYALRPWDTYRLQVYCVLSESFAEFLLFIDN